MTVAAFALWGISANAQVKIGDNPTTVGASSLLELESTTKGLVLPRMTTAERTAIASPVQGMQVYDTTTGTIWYRNASTWVNTAIATTTAANGLAIVSGNVELGGALTKPTTISGVDATNKLSITATGVDAVNIDSNTLSIDATNNRVGIGTATPTGQLSLGSAIGTKKVILYDEVPASSNQFYGFGIQSNYLQYHVPNASSNHAFYSGTGLTSSVELMRITGTGNVGIGVAAPAAKLDVNGTIKISGGTPGLNKVLTSDASGLASWATPTAVTVSNGLTASAGDVKLGGSLTAATTIALNSNTLALTGTSVNAFSVDGSTFSVDSANNRIGIGTATPNAAAALDITSTTTGFLPPRMTTAQRSAIATPTEGLTIYNTTLRCIEFFTNNGWYSPCPVTNPSSNGTAVVSAWSCATANAGTLTAGTAASGVTNTVTATVTTAGTYNINIQLNGITFSGSGTFPGTGAQNVVLTATGTPLYGGTFAYALTTTPSCSFNRTVAANATSGGSAVVSAYTSTASTGAINALSAVGINVTQTITATVTTAGTYNISATASGVTFTGQGTFAGTGSQTVVLTATGTTTADYDAAPIAFTLATTPSANFTRAISIPGNYAICDPALPNYTAVVDIVTLTGKTWMDRNLGATRVAENVYDPNAYGCHYQWGRGTDKHANMFYNTNGTVITRPYIYNGSPSVTPGNGNLYIGPAPWLNWMFTDTDNLWQGVAGVNNPCPSGYRIPTFAEWNAEFAAYGVTNTTGNAWTMPHKLSASSLTNGPNALLNTTGSGIYVHSTTAGNGYIAFSRILANGTYYGSYGRVKSDGVAVRCIKN